MKCADKKLVLIQLFTMILIGILLMDCSFDYSKANIEDSLDETLPDIVMENVKLVFIRGTKIIIEADSAEIYSGQQQQTMFNVRFSEISRDDEVRMEGHVAQIAIETNTNDIIMVGDVWVRSHKDEAEVQTEYLHWNDEDRIIEGSVIYPVTITKDIGSTISGYGFRGSAEKRELSITKSTVGKLVVDD